MMTELYEQDYHAWAATNASLLRQQRFAEADMAHIAEELEDMSKRERRTLQSHLEIILLHLLKWRYQAHFRTPSWRLSIENARQGVEKTLLDSPSLKPTLDEIITRAYPYAKRSAVAETGLAAQIFPLDCPFTKEQILEPGFLPHAES